MTNNVVDLPVITTLDIPSERVLNSASKRGMDDVVVIGYDNDGEFYFASNKADRGTVIWLLELAKKKLLELDED